MQSVRRLFPTALPLWTLATPAVPAQTPATRTVNVRQSKGRVLNAELVRNRDRSFYRLLRRAFAIQVFEVYLK
jgi:hypothetical protein